MSAEDDDGFDWEAAVREIDVACQSTSTATSSSNTIHHHHPVSNITNLSFNTPKNDHININRKKKNKQSTLTTYFRSETNRSIEIDNDFDISSSVEIDAEAAKTWIYPVSDSTPLRNYQFSITKTTLFSNTLVVVPTGLGKTFIAAVVMYNYFRWFPQGKIVFAAPSRPLVTQQKEACHKIVGIPLECTIDLTGTTSPKARADFWKSKRVFFVTPQVLEKDIESGKCIVNCLVCLVMDEAHRAQGKYSYSVVARKLMDIPIQLRILALTATPGSNQQTIQQVIDNLQISTLEYRTESDPDVSMYVHKRKLDLVVVEMDQDALEINNLLCEVIRPYMIKLSAGGVHMRDFITLSPNDFLQARDKFRAAPPVEVAPTKYGEFEGYFGVLITIYYIRKLLSSHGIRSAYKMLVEKIKNGGSFARLTSKTEALHKAKHQMSKSISRGMPSTKISKLTEVLTCHFQENPQSSRVIIFSNFRESVSEIMNALGEMGDDVQATEFIGQSTGKTSKGQSQKVQQAVLEKFRSGGYNVIVATSIGEEGLDIMEVDLVICFDANISALRMIQRMGRTGRKHDGRVVVLAYVGLELDGYNRKQVNSKKNVKHMLNGGINSFEFHSSPRMVPHVFKPEVQFVELLIEQFVHHGQRAADDNQTLMFANALADTEKKLITQYFHPNGEKKRRLSLIAFPHFQAFPSRVHQVMHSSRTGILIDAMQHLQEVSISKDSRILIEDVAPSGHVSEDLKALSEEILDPHIFDTSPKSQSQRNVLDLEESPVKSFPKMDEHSTPGFNGQKTFSHSYLFGSDFVSVDALGKVIIISVPFLPLKEISNLKDVSRSNSKLLNCKHDYKAPTSKANSVVDLTDSSNARCTNSKNVVISKICHQETLLNEGEALEWTLNHMENKSPIRLANGLRDIELSPRLTNLIKSGVVPESPLYNGLSDCEGKEEFLNLDIVSPTKLPTELLDNSVGGVKMNNLPRSACGSDFPNCEEGTNLTNNSCSKDWLLNSQDGTGSIKQRSKFRRLRKLGDSCKRSTKCIKTSGSIPKKHCRGTRKPDVRVFIEDEAEVSSDDSQSDDEEDEEDDSGDPSFIDDKLNPTAASPQAGHGVIDMMAIYRRSLLSQSPMERASNNPASITPDSVAHNSRSNGSGSCSSKTPHLLDTPKAESEHAESALKNYALCQTNPPDTTLSESMLCKTSLFEKEIMDTRKRKLTCYQMGSVPAVNLIEKFSCQLEGSVIKESSAHCEPEANGDVFYDDEFYESLDLDAVEAEATMLLSYKSDCSIQKQEKPPDHTQNHAFLSSPSFDLGI